MKAAAATGMIGTILALATGESQAQSNLLAGVKDLHATDFTSEQYFEPPNEQRVKVRLTGASADPLPGGLLAVKHLKIESFNTNSVLQAEIQAPQCTFAPLDGVVSSPGRLEIKSGDGKFRTSGDGFLWRQNDSWLVISNRVQTEIEMPK